MRLSIGISALAIAAGLLAGVQPAQAAGAMACHVSPGIPYKGGGFTDISEKTTC
ncbi:hypothetical protein [Nonomuraea sp. NPDC049504]|jgi:hypothetical protein|uniref:hypothetical protein n=1 Tax=Nonomuraea sp. NPDC049504 TaxID=3154729 RepID=UPI00342B408B